MYQLTERQTGVAVRVPLLSTLLVIFGLLLTGCAATTTAISKRNLDVQTKMSASIFLDPVSPDKRVVLVQVRNTSDRPDFDVESHIKGAVVSKGYRLTENPDEAHYILQANVLQVGRADPSAADKALAGEYGGALDGFVTGAAIGDALGGGRKTNTATGLIGGLLGTIANAAVKDVTYSIITDIQISERAREGVEVFDEQQAQLQQGTSGYRTVSSNEISDWKRYQTRIVSTANKVNLKFEEASGMLVQGLVRSLSGIL